MDFRMMSHSLSMKSSLSIFCSGDYVTKHIFADRFNRIRVITDMSLKKTSSKSDLQGDCITTELAQTF